LQLFSHFESSLLLPFLEEFVHLPVQFHVFLIELSLSSPRILWDEGRFNVLVEPVQQDIRKDRAHHAPHNVANFGYGDPMEWMG